MLMKRIQKNVNILKLNQKNIKVFAFQNKVNIIIVQSKENKR